MRMPSDKGFEKETVGGALADFQIGGCDHVAKSCRGVAKSATVTERHVEVEKPHVVQAPRRVDGGQVYAAVRRFTICIKPNRIAPCLGSGIPLVIHDGKFVVRKILDDGSVAIWNKASSNDVRIDDRIIAVNGVCDSEGIDVCLLYAKYLTITFERPRACVAS